MGKWNATLSNKVVCFDSASGFETLKEALEWASGRGDDYVIHIDDGENFPGLHLCVTNGTLKFKGGHPLQPEWESVTDIDKFCEAHG